MIVRANNGRALDCDQALRHGYELTASPLVSSPIVLIANLTRDFVNIEVAALWVRADNIRPDEEIDYSVTRFIW